MPCSSLHHYNPSPSVQKLYFAYFPATWFDENQEKESCCQSCWSWVTLTSNVSATKYPIGIKFVVPNSAEQGQININLFDFNGNLKFWLSQPRHVKKNGSPVIPNTPQTFITHNDIWYSSVTCPVRLPELGFCNHKIRWIKPDNSCSFFLNQGLVILWTDFYFQPSVSISRKRNGAICTNCVKICGTISDTF